MFEISDERLGSQLNFLSAIDDLKGIERASLLISSRRRENPAEHSWHIAMAVLILSEYSDEDIDIGRTLQMVLIHDLVEIVSGDNPVYENFPIEQQLSMERKGLQEILSKLPPNQAKNLEQLWEEFTNSSTAEARFAQAMDRIIPLIQNVASSGATWKSLARTPKPEEVKRRNSPISNSSEHLWDAVCSLIDKAEKDKLLG